EPLAVAQLPAEIRQQARVTRLLQERALIAATPQTAAAGGTPLSRRVLFVLMLLCALAVLMPAGVGAVAAGDASHRPEPGHRDDVGPLGRAR
ncbi:hypothetical protein C7E12_05925, partial [Stenotrophomonas maltophilia]